MGGRYKISAERNRESVCVRERGGPRGQRGREKGTRRAQGSGCALRDTASRAPRRGARGRAGLPQAPTWIPAETPEGCAARPSLNCAQLRVSSQWSQAAANDKPHPAPRGDVS
ncbi:RNA-binding protein 14 [Platysternon megacephalum]|uniref:RNA-binding protein 14 n=1 Tax=Platysternon megacephalum TaxID=55544 RepID=A0A4D9EZI8_9SAUR|nr:RNA-binding protein 14 [Platysternon megacephalum]